MEKNFTYINEHYITEDNLCDMTGITKSELNALIEKQLVPDASYTVTRTIKITSSLND